MSINFDLRRTVLTNEVLQKSYSSEEYNRALQNKNRISKDKTTIRAIRHCLKYLIANNCTRGCINIYIQKKVKKQQTKCLVRKDKLFHDFTPLMLASVIGRIDVVKMLLRVKSVQQDVNSTNTFGWTALHLARLSSSDRISTLLQSHGADPKAMTNAGGTPADIKALTTHGIKSVSAEQVFWESEIFSVSFSKLMQDGNLELAAGFKEYRDIDYIPPIPSALMQLMTHMPEHSVSGKAKRILHEKYFDYITGKKVPSFTAAIEDQCQRENLHPVRGLKTREEQMPFLEFVGPYVGEAWNEHDDSDYIAGFVDAQDYGDHTRYITWGPSNVLWEEISINGITVAVILVAKEKGLTRGDFLYLHYGSSYMVDAILRPFYIFNKEQLKEFFRDGLAAVIEKWNKIKKDEYSPNLTKRVLANNFFNNLEYPACCPGAILYLHFKGIVNIKEWQNVLFETKSEIFDEWRDDAASFGVLTIIEEALKDVLFMEQDLDDNKLNEFRDWVSEMMIKISFKELQDCLHKYRLSITEDDQDDNKKEII